MNTSHTSTDPTQDPLSSITQEEEQKVYDEEITLDHTPTLSQDMKMFSHEHEHDDHHNQKWKHKLKAFFSYFAGGVSIFALSVFGFLSGSPGHENLSASLTHAPETETKSEEIHALPSFSSAEECIVTFIKESSHEHTHEDFKKQEMFCQQFSAEKKHNTH